MKFRLKRKGNGKILVQQGDSEWDMFDVVWWWTTKEVVSTVMEAKEALVALVKKELGDCIEEDLMEIGFSNLSV